MKKKIIFNFECIEIPQIPDNNGKYKYESFYKYDFIIKNDLKYSLGKQNLKIIFNENSQIIKSVVAIKGMVRIRINNNIAFFTINNFEKKQIFNIDFFVTNANLNEKIELVSEKEDIKIRRNNKRKVKKIIIQKENISIFLKIKKLLNHVWFVTIIGGIIVSIIGYFIIAYFFNNSIDSVKSDKVNSDLKKINNSINIDTLNIDSVVKHN